MMGVRLKGFDSVEAGVVLANDVRQEAAETFRGVGAGLVDLEEAVGAREFEHDGCLGGERGELEIAVALHGFVHALQKNVDAGGVDLADLRHVENDLRTIGAEEGTDFRKEVTRLFKVELLGNAFYDYRPTRFHISSRLPGRRKIHAPGGWRSCLGVP